MRIAAAFASFVLFLGISASGEESTVPIQFPRPRVAPPPPPPQPAPVWTLPFPACDRIPQPPRYPAIALAKGEQGVVRMAIYVLVSGGIKEAIVVQSSGSALLDEAAVASTRSWSLVPGRQGPYPASMWSEAIVTFRMQAGEPGSSNVEVRFPMAADIDRCLV